MSVPTIGSTLRAFTKRLTEATVDSPRLSAEVLLAHAMNVPRETVLKQAIIAPGTSLPQEEYDEALSLIARRAQGEPVAYLTGTKEFFGRSFSVTPATLIPRPETELLIETALSHLRLAPHQLPSRFVDMGTGSGCIAITLALELNTWTGLAVDKSPAALEVARANAARLNASNVNFLEADFHQLHSLGLPLGLFVTNPPYVSPAEYQTLSHEVGKYEPQSALVPESSTPDSPGLEDVETLITLAAHNLVSGGLFLAEIGHLQGQSGVKLFNNSQWQQVCVIPDLAGLDRVLFAIRR